MNATTIPPTNPASKPTTPSDPVQIEQWKKRALTTVT